MIAKKKVIWEDWRLSLPGNTEKQPNKFKLKKDVRLELSDQYQSIRIVNEKPHKSYPYSFSMPCEYNMEINGESVHIRYFDTENTEISEGKKGSFPRHTPLEFNFENGILIIPRNRLDMYWFFLNHPHNESNPKYQGEEGKHFLAMRDRPFIFKERNEEAELEVKATAEELEFEALHRLNRTMTEEEQRTLYAAYGHSDHDTVSIKKVKSGLRGYAMADPKYFLEQMESDVVKMKVVVMDCKELNIINFDKRSRAWKFSNEDQVNICTVAAGVDIIKPLITWLRERDANGETFKVMKELLVARRKHLKGEDLDA